MLIDPQPAESKWSHDVGRIWPRSCCGASSFASDVSTSLEQVAAAALVEGQGVGVGSVSSLRMALT